MPNRDLFEELKDIVRCEYISDLRYAPWIDKARKAIAGMNLSAYSCLHSETPPNTCTQTSRASSAMKRLRSISERGCAVSDRYEVFPGEQTGIWTVLKEWAEENPMQISVGRKDAD